MPERDKIDALLDAALGTYAEPRTGLEQRILAHVEGAQSSQMAPWRRWLGWELAATLAASVLLYSGVSVVWHHRTKSAPTASKREQASALRMPNTQPEPLRSIASHPRGPAPTRHRDTHAETVATGAPKLDVFPAPRPLSPQEQALVALARQSAEVRQQALPAQGDDDAPLQISAIQIPPIPPPDEGENQGEKP